MALIIGLVLFPVQAFADAPLTDSTVLQGRYAWVADGIGLHDSDTGQIILTVPGTPVKAFLYWAQHEEPGCEDSQVKFVVDGGPVNYLDADTTYGADYWYGSDPGQYNFVFVEDVTEFVLEGRHTYRIGDFIQCSSEGGKYGVGLVIFYEDASLPEVSLDIRSGLDAAYWDFPTPRGPNSDVTCVDFSASSDVRDLDLSLFVGGYDDSGANRPNALWYQTGSGSHPGNLVGQSAASEFVGQPFNASDGAEWDTYSNSIPVPAGHTYACVQLESVADQSPLDGASLIVPMIVFSIEPDTRTATPTNTPLPSDTPVPSETQTDAPAPSDTPVPSETPTDAPAPSDTPVPSETSTEAPAPSDTPVPSETSTEAPAPSDTPVPSETPTDAPAPSDTPPPSATSPASPPPQPEILVVDPAVSKSVNPSQARAGERVTFTLRVTNHGNITATDVVVTDPVPLFLEIISASTSKGTIAIDRAHNTVIVDIGTVHPEQVVTIVIVTEVDEGVNQTVDISNVATLEHETGGELSSERSNRADVRLLGAPVLPDTGEEEAEIATSVRLSTTLIISLTLAVFGMLIATLGIAREFHRHHSGIRVVFVGLIFCGASMVFGLVAISNTPAEAASAEVPTQRDVASLDQQSVARLTIPTSTPEVEEILPVYPTPIPPSEDQSLDSSSVTRIEIPILSVAAEVHYVPFDGLTWDMSGLRHEVAWLGETSWPGLGGNTVLAGHVSLRGGEQGPFHDLEHLNPGDQVIVYTELGKYTYQIREQMIVEPTDVYITEQSTGYPLTLLTCTNWDPETGKYLQRRAVFAELQWVESLEN